jgi:hypothetical protein
MNINSFALMNDGRNFSNWQPESAINEKMQKNAGIKSNWDLDWFYGYCNDAQNFSSTWWWSLKA